MTTTSHGYTWQTLRRIDAQDLESGDIIVNPVHDAAYHHARDGRVQPLLRGMEDMLVPGEAWAITDRTGNRITAVRLSDGHQDGTRIPPGRAVLRVDPEQRRLYLAPGGGRDAGLCHVLFGLEWSPQAVYCPSPAAVYVEVHADATLCTRVCATHLAWASRLPGFVHGRPLAA